MYVYLTTIKLYFFLIFRTRLPDNVTNCSHYAYLEDLYDILLNNEGKRFYTCSRIKLKIECFVVNKKILSYLLYCTYM